MTPTIRVDDEVYEALKARAEPFVDTPNAVVRRLLDLPEQNGSGTLTQGGGEDPVGDSPEDAARRSKSSGRGRKRQRAARGTLVPQEDYLLPLLRVLAEKGGRASAAEVTDVVGERLKDQLGDVDRERTGSGEIRWRNRTQFARLALVKSGEMKADSPRGIWELTEKGARRAKGGGR